MPPSRPLTDTVCKNAKSKDKKYKLADGEGMYLEVRPNGSKYWRLKYRFNGKEKMLALGVYPAITLAAAREKRRDARIIIAAGGDPAEQKQEQKRTAKLNAANTFETVAREWYEHSKGARSAKHALGLLRRLEADIFPEIGNRPIANITARHILDALRKIEDRGAHEVTRRTRQIVGQVFRYAVVTDRAERNPVPDTQGALKPFRPGHYAALEADDLPEFLAAMERNDGRLYMPTRCATKLLMYTFVRTGELIESKWSEFNFDRKEWLIPAERMKMRRPHIVPLSRQAITLLEEMKSLTGKWEWVFPNQVSPKKHMSNATILRALDRMGYKGRMTGHGFRALALSTIKERLGYRHEVVDRQLAHVPRNKVDAAYDRAQFLDERRKMMQEWADYLDGIKKRD
jgi:integrase